MPQGLQRRNLWPAVAQGVESTANAAGMADDPALARTLWRYWRTPAELRKAVAPLLASSAAIGGIEGAAKSFKDQYNGERERWMQQTYGRQPTGGFETLGLDGLRVMENVGNAIAYDVPGKVGAALGSAAYDVLHPRGLQRR